MIFKNLFKRKNKIRKLEQELSPTFEYDFTMGYIKTVLSLEKTLEDKVNMLNFIMEAIRKDIQYDLLSKFLYSDMENIYLDKIFPIGLFSEDKTEKRKAIMVNEEKIIDLSKDTVILLPWERFRFLDTVKYVYKDKFRYKKDSHKASYYSDVNITYVFSGNHSIATGIIRGEGKILAKEYDISNLFNYLTTDGLYWYIDGEKYIDKVFDFRIAVLYELAKIKYKLQKK